MAGERNVLTWAMSEDHVTYWLHQIDHADLDARERQAVRHLRSSMIRTLRQRDAVQAARDSFRVNALTGLPEPTGAQRTRFHDASVQFFEGFYSTLSSWASLLVRLAARLKLTTPPTSSMAKFIVWLTDQPPFDPVEASRLAVLERARQFRALTDHPGQVQPFDWDMDAPEGFALRLRLFGPTRNMAPVGAEAGTGPLAAEGGWSFLAPDEFDVTNALAELLPRFPPLISGMFPLPESVPVSCPDFGWERDWNGSHPIYSEPESVYLNNGRMIDPMSGDLVADPLLTKGTARCSVARGMVTDPVSPMLRALGWGQYEAEADLTVHLDTCNRSWVGRRGN